MHTEDEALGRLEAGRDQYAETLPILRGIQDAGYEALLVGGGVRDLLLGRPVADWDIATNAIPEVVAGLFPDTVPTGLPHGTITVLHRGDPFEVTTYRTDGPYSDGRRPDWVAFGAELREDLARRDFTINALAFDPLNRKFHDPFHGQEDLRNRLIRTVGRPEDRFEEDSLRPIRGIRLATVLEFAIEPATFQAMQGAKAGLQRVAVERVREELHKLMQARRPSRGFDYLRRSGLLKAVLPELAEGYGMYQNKHHAHDVFWHTLYTVDAAPRENRVVRWAALLHDIAKPRTRQLVDGEGTFHNHQVLGVEMAEAVLDRLRFSKQERQRILRLVQEHMFHYTPDWTDSAVRRFIQRVGRDYLEDLFALRVADNIGNGLKEAQPDSLWELRRRVAEVLKREDALSLDALAVDGAGVMEALDMDPGPEVGAVLLFLLEKVVEDPSLNEAEILVSLMKSPEAQEAIDRARRDS